MRRIVLAEGEDLVVRFHPHWASRLGRYLADALWVVYGALAWFVATKLTGSAWMGWATLALAALVHGGIAWRLERRGVTESVVWGLLAVVGATGVLPLGPLTPFGPLGVGLLATLVGGSLSQVIRIGDAYFLTTRRLVAWTGVAHRTEHTIDWDRVESVRASQHVLGRLFGYGTLTLVLAAKARPKVGAPEATFPLEGVPRWQYVRRDLEGLLEERKLPARERQRRLEERRLRASMAALAQWAGRQRA